MEFNVSRSTPRDFSLSGKYALAFFKRKSLTMISVLFFFANLKPIQKEILIYFYINISIADILNTYHKVSL